MSHARVGVAKNIKSVAGGKMKKVILVVLMCMLVFTQNSFAGRIYTLKDKQPAAWSYYDIRDWDKMAGDTSARYRMMENETIFATCGGMQVMIIEWIREVYCEVRPMGELFTFWVLSNAFERN